MGAKAGGPRFCTSASLGCTFKNHGDKKANVKPGHVYLGSESGKKSTGWLGWCLSIEVFGGREGKLLALCLLGWDMILPVCGNSTNAPFQRQDRCVLGRMGPNY